MRTLAILALVVIPMASLSAQDMERPEGWNVRFDRPGSTEADLDTFVAMPPGWHITTGPAAIFWQPELTAEGRFRASLDVFLFDPQGRREAFGLFVGGHDLEGPNQSYLYFVIRDGGQFLVKRRHGSETSTIVAWTNHAAIRSFADRGAETSVRNVLEIEGDGETVHFSVNGQEVTSLPRADLVIDGIVGLRVNHALNLHVSELAVTPIE